MSGLWVGIGSHELSAGALLPLFPPSLPRSVPPCSPGSHASLALIRRIPRGWGSHQRRECAGFSPPRDLIPGTTSKQRHPQDPTLPVGKRALVSNTHTQTHTHGRTRTHIHICVQTCVCLCRHTHTYSSTCTRTTVLVRTHTDTRVWKYTHTHTCTHTRMPIRMHLYVCRHKYTQTHHINKIRTKSIIQLYNTIHTYYKQDCMQFYCYWLTDNG